MVYAGASASNPNSPHLKVQVSSIRQGRFLRTSLLPLSFGFASFTIEIPSKSKCQDCKRYCEHEEKPEIWTCFETTRVVVVIE